MILTTVGMGMPGLMSFVFSLKSLQKAPILTPFWNDTKFMHRIIGKQILRSRALTCPSAGPSGGDGEALPAGMYIRRVLASFATLPRLAILQLSSLRPGVTS